ncbi:hypothetical protein PUNSTDRAFT_60685 [Punctularia strigosozonata HHB-11173 SS5]|uniref:uncharacterized protein n=1 Tax=Punctularia strigosozonata (strain HHB-11173) TaxID=741275 RepID=UPI0004417AED|nr:uncharacterized protein PUNSTDRAFT_60685 [Punctularia strigosozonata HHB-11173 SS5]EIN12982.1 hypothetical protein PUNSTDRAFT_60685 [Punctularia strigosozonata HHB-11173 SS5]
MTVDDSSAQYAAILDSVNGEVSFFRNLMRARPVGIHRHFHVLTIRNGVHKDTGEDVSVEDIWKKLRTCYDLDNLEALEPEGYDPSGEPSSPRQVESPSPTDNLASHPFFRYEFVLPADEHLEAEIARRRMRNSTSLPSSPVATPPPPLKGRRSLGRGVKGKGRKASLAGLVGGDSDSSALTQESGEDDDASIAPTVTGTDAGTEDLDEEDEEAEGQSPGKLPATLCVSLY